MVGGTCTPRSVNRRPSEYHRLTGGRGGRGGGPLRGAGGGGHGRSGGGDGRTGGGGTGEGVVDVDDCEGRYKQMSW